MQGEVIEDLKTAIGAVIVAALSALGLWLRVSRARATTSKDSLEVKENTSQADWLRRLEERFEQERQRAEAAEARARTLFEELQEAKSRLRETDMAVQLRGERIQRLERRCNRLIELVAKAQPEMQFLVTEPAPLEDLKDHKR